MDFLGIGPLELVFIFLIILIVLGPQEIVKTGQILGRYLRRLMTSPTWRLIQDTSREIRTLPNKLARQAGLEELQSEVKQATDIPELADFKQTIGQDIPFEAWVQPADGDQAPLEAPAPDSPTEPQTEADDQSPPRSSSEEDQE